MSGFIKNKYDQIYKSIGFERSGLFKLIKDEFDPTAVIYPGSSIHVTPSFYFRHVVYIDKSEQAMDFFSKDSEVSDLINKNKTYRESAYWRFMRRDFQTDLGLSDNSFDLLLSLFSGKLIDYCERYVKPNGLILTTSLFSDHDSIKERAGFKLLGLIRCKDLRYYLDNEIQHSQQKHSRLKQSNKGLEYVDNETYYIYQKVSSDPLS